MKNCFLALITLSFFLSSCKEEGPFIILNPPAVALVDTNYLTNNVPDAAPKTILLEEFTGVRCTNCPSGHARVAELYNTYPGRFVAIAIHTNFLGAPYGNDLDLRTENGETLGATLGPINGKPSAFIDRKQFSTVATRDVINPDLWPPLVAEQMNLSSPVNIELEKVNLDENSRILRYRVTLSYTENAQNHNLGFAITENNIVAAQLSSGTIIENYVHKHVLRDYLSPIIGQPLTENLERGRVIIKEFEFEIPLGWNIQNLELIAFIRQSNDEIVNAAFINLN
jgi:hypothetical protein